jgi:agmatinase
MSFAAFSAASAAWSQQRSGAAGWRDPVRTERPQREEKSVTGAASDESPRRPVAYPAFAGIATFMRALQVPIDAVPAHVVVVSGIPVGGLGESSGPAEGPRGVREASVAFLASLLPSMRGALVDVDTERRLEFPADLPLVDVGDFDSLAGSGGVMEQLRGHAAALARRAGLSVFLGGTRAVTTPLIQGVARGTGRRLALLRLSATLDLEDESGDHALSPGASVCAAVNSSIPVISLGAGGFLPTAEWAKATDRGVRVISVDAWRKAGLAATARDAVGELLQRADQLYLSVDIRVTDGAMAAGRGRIVTGGLWPAELLAVCETLAAVPLAGIDVVEVAPPLDSTRRAEQLAFRALLTLLTPRLAASKASSP